VATGPDGRGSPPGREAEASQRPAPTEVIISACVADTELVRLRSLDAAPTGARDHRSNHPSGTDLPPKSRQGGALFTIGYEGKTVEELVHSLLTQRVTVLVDVRENAISRKSGFSKRALAEALGNSGIRYQHEPLLGNPRENRAPFRQGAAEARERYLRRLQFGSRTAFESVVGMALSQRIALLCFERDEAVCHRRCIVELAQREEPALSSIAL
jgi:hypothetical protein